MWDLIEQKSMTMTKSLAKRVSSAKPVPNERRHSALRSNILARQIERGEIIPFNWALAQLPNGDIYRVNGQHTSALFANGTAIPTGAVVNFQLYSAKTMDDVVNLWSRFDPASSARTKTDNQRIHLGSHEAFAEVSVKVGSACISAITMNTYGAASQNKITMHERCSVIDEYPEFVLWVNELARGKDRKHLLRSGVVWAMFRTWERDRKACIDFWQAVAEGDGDKRSPQRVLERFLLTHDASRGRGVGTAKSKATAREFMAKSIYAWNAWREGRKTLECLRYYQDAADPEVK